MGLAFKGGDDVSVPWYYLGKVQVMYQLDGISSEDLEGI